MSVYISAMKKPNKLPNLSTDRFVTVFFISFAYLIIMFHVFLAQLSHSVLMQSVWRKPYIASLEIWTFGLWTDGLLDRCKLWTVGPFDYYSYISDG